MKDHALVNTSAPENVDSGLGPEPDTIDTPVASPESANIPPVETRPVNDPHLLTTATDAQPETPVAEAVEPEQPVADGMVDFVDEFGESHRLPPQTAAYMRFLQTKSPVVPNPPAPLPPQPVYQQPVYRQPATPEEAEDQWTQRFNSLERNVTSIQGLLNNAVQTNVANAKIADANAYLNGLANEVPMFKSRPAIFEHVKADLAAKVENALRTNPSMDISAVRSAIFHEAMTSGRQLVSLLTREMQTTTQQIAGVNKQALPPPGGKQPVNRPKPINYNNPEEVAEATYRSLIASNQRRGVPVR